MPAAAVSTTVIRRLRDFAAAGRWTDVLAAYDTLDPAIQSQAEVGLIGATAAARLGQLDRAAALGSEALERFRMRADTDGRLRAVNLLGAISFE
ncbi:MAG: hypothetical protein H0U85_09510, partial [Gemmatimonadales bacterium]|nr:hypothetical protein [Gemmatimonadales bacterium]